eukprot:gene24300-biopygen17908
MLSRVGTRDLGIPAFAPQSGPPHARAPGAQMIRPLGRPAGENGSLNVEIPTERDREQVGQMRCWGGPRGGLAPFPPCPLSRTPYPHPLNPKGRSAPHQRWWGSRAYWRPRDGNGGRLSIGRSASHSGRGRAGSALFGINHVLHAVADHCRSAGEGITRPAAEAAAASVPRRRRTRRPRRQRRRRWRRRQRRQGQRRAAQQPRSRRRRRGAAAAAAASAAAPLTAEPYRA